MENKMSQPLRKIGFYSIKLCDKGDESKIHSPEELKRIIKSIGGLSKNARRMDIGNTNKFYFLKDIKTKTDIQNIIFESAKYNHRPPLIDKDTLDERDSPKKLTEGELEKTHLALRYLNDEIVALLEERKSGLTIHRITEYIDTFGQNHSLTPSQELPFHLRVSVIGKKDFLSHIEKLRRAIQLDASLSKQLLGSEFLEYADKTEEAKETMTLTIKAQRNKSLKELIKQFLKRHLEDKTKIKKIRVTGISEEGTKVVFDTDIIRKLESVPAEIDTTTGVVESDKLFNELNKVLLAHGQ